METLTAEEARVLGCLIEKERTTPEYYPLTVNALAAACNQKTNRHPVVTYDDLTIEQALHSLDERRLIGITRATGGRVIKYMHRADDAYEVDEEQLALLAVLLLRGPQTPGELRARTERYFPSEQPLETIESLLDDLMNRSDALVERLPREPGQKEHRFRCLMTEPDDVPQAASPPASTDGISARMAQLEVQLQALAASLGVDLDELTAESTDHTGE